MINSFTYNKAAALRSEGGNYIDSTGEHIVTIAQASTAETPNRAQYIRFVFKDDNGAVCQSDLFITKKDGSPSFGEGMFHALLKIVNVPNVSVTDGKVTNIYDREHPYDGKRIKGIEGRRVGVLLQKELYLGKKPSGEVVDRYRMNVRAFFDFESRMTAAEIERGADATRIDAMLKTLKDEDKRQSSGFESPARKPSAPSQSFDKDDDCPL